ncbi:tetratricopeptide repeat protein [Lutibacter citreus]|uniref:tetratricopeptide repeat protein n=1 Tax=Lutibacter citreus TaxID=2138210 RepID=UPI000DBE3D02|nr:tetratricopeptide repeat protein [Lutibacter citreus]
MRKQLLILSAFFISMTIFGQKNEIKSAEKAIKIADFATAISSIKQAEGLIGNADQKTKAKFYYLKAMALYEGGKNTNVKEISSAFSDLIKFEKETNKLKYSKEIKGLKSALVQKTATRASENYKKASESKEPGDFVKAAKGFEQVYTLSPSDTSFLDNAALVYFLGKDYENSKKSYSKLLELGYTGVATEYIATNKQTGQDVSYPDKKSMDLQVKLGLAKDPREEVKDSRRELIFKNLAQNYTKLENNEKALEVIAEGRKEFPKSYSLLIDEANLYYNAGDNNKFKEKLEEAISLNPTEPTLYYNVGVMNMDQGNTEEAIKYFKKSIELNPTYADSYNNIGAAIIDKAAPIIEEMNKNLSDFAKYDKLQAEQFEIYKEALPYYEKAYELSSDNLNIVQTLMGLYENLDMQDKLSAIKEVYEKLK